MRKQFRSLAQDFKKAVTPKFADEVPATLGLADGTVNASPDGMVYAVIDGSGQIVKAFNSTVPNKFNLKVYIGFKKGFPRVLQVLRQRNSYDLMQSLLLPFHHKSHEWPGSDTTWIQQEQIIPLLILPTGFGVQVYGATLLWPDGLTYVTIATQTLDLTTSVPTAGALYALIQAANTGAVSAKVSAAVSSPELLTNADIPLPDTNCVQLAAVKLYSGQTAINRNGQINDFVDLRIGAGGGGGGGFGYPDLAQGAEELLNPQFLSDASNWTVGAGWAWAGGEMVHTPGSDEALSQVGNLTVGIDYGCSVSAIVSAGTLDIVTENSAPFTISATGTHYFQLACSANTNVKFAMWPSVDFDGSVDTVSEKRSKFIQDVNQDGTVYGRNNTGWVTIPASGHTIQDEGAPLAARANLNFVGAGVTATDDAGNDATLITIPAGGTPGGSDTQMQFNDGGVFGGDAELVWDKVNKILTIGSGGIPIAGGNRINFFGEGSTAPRWTTYSYNDTPTSGVPGLTTVRGGGTKASPTQTKSGMIVGQWAGLGYDNTNAIVATQVKILLIADADWTTTSRPVRIEMYTTPSGSTTPVLALTIKADGTIDIATGKTYNINGSPHTHGAGDPPATTAANDFQVGNGAGAWIKKTLAEIKTILGLGTAAYTASSDYAISAKGVTNGDTHNHVGGDGAVLHSVIVLPMHGMLGTIAAGATYGLSPFNFGLSGTFMGFIIPRAGTLKNLYFKTYDTQPSTGRLEATVVSANIGSTTLVANQPAGSAAGTFSDTVHTVNVSAGDGVYVTVKNWASATSSRIGPATFELEVETT